MYLYDLVPLWLNKCRFKCISLINVLSHSLHKHGLCESQQVTSYPLATRYHGVAELLGKEKQKFYHENIDMESFEGEIELVSQCVWGEGGGNSHKLLN